jgi:protein SCO1/2
MSLSAASLNASRFAATAALTLVVAGWAAVALSRQDDNHAPLSKIGPAPDFTLTNQDGKPLALAALRGKVVAVTFIFTGCGNTCPLLTAKMVSMQKSLGADFGPRVFFVAITVDPLADTPPVLKRYANAHGADLGGWAFLTGTPAQISDIAHRYGVYYKRQPGDDIDHTFLTSVIDPGGALRVQYLGVRFDPEEFLQDIRSLLREGK